MHALNVDEKNLLRALGKMLGAEVQSAEYETERLHGGTLGDVRLVTGVAKTADGGELPCRVVVKTQKKWERSGDPGSWRREYDLYASELGECFTQSFRWPECYLAEIDEGEGEITLWMEYVEGVTGTDMTPPMYERAAYELGRFQGRQYAEKPAFLRKTLNLSVPSFVKDYYLRYRSWPVVYDYIRSEDCEIPKHLCGMLIKVDESADEILADVGRLPIVLCHRDYWVANLFVSDGRIVAIDWDTAGWGYLGEDIAALIADEADVNHMTELYRRCVPAYYRGFSEFSADADIVDHRILELILLLFGYRLVEWFLHAESPEEKALQLQTLKKIYEMKEE